MRTVSVFTKNGKGVERERSSFPAVSGEDLERALFIAQCYADGAGLEYVPRSVIVYLDGKVLYTLKCNQSGKPTDSIGLGVRKHSSNGPQPKIRPLPQKLKARENHALARRIEAIVLPLRPEHVSHERHAPVPHIPTPALTSGWCEPRMEKVMSLRQYESFPHRLEEWLANEEV